MLGYGGAGAPAPAGAYNNQYTVPGQMPSYQGYSMWAETSTGDNYDDDLAAETIHEPNNNNAFLSDATSKQTMFNCNLDQWNFHLFKNQHYFIMIYRAQCYLWARG